MSNSHELYSHVVFFRGMSISLSYHPTIGASAYSCFLYREPLPQEGWSGNKTCIRQVAVDLKKPTSENTNSTVN